MNELKYSELTQSERKTARVMFLNALNDMEQEQATDNGTLPKPYKMSSPLFKQMIPETYWERYTDENGQSRIRKL